ncbi:nuclear transport factor 2 family protein [Ottowia caeni]|uniref:nuclear transport factor 2 family protein n=1 Tax=Ottowia caeni TaxID=2870339 RepID=UPI001E3E40BD|nr:nuclear transport factor 2 family protein [Ottowia caeni]
MTKPRLSTQADIQAACGQLIVDFANGLDHKDYAKVLGVFADDATLDRAGQVIRGIEEIRSFLGKRPVNQVTRHLCTNISIRARSDDQADGTCYVHFFQSPNEEGHPLPVKAAVTAIVEYIVGFFQRDGVWQIKELKIQPVFDA